MGPSVPDQDDVACLHAMVDGVAVERPDGSCDLPDSPLLRFGHRFEGAPAIVARETGSRCMMNTHFSHFLWQLFCCYRLDSRYPDWL
jgi:hypothetical protein